MQSFEVGGTGAPVAEPLDAWIGRAESRTDVVTAWPAVALAATLDRHDPEPKPGDALPPGWHWLYFLEAAPASELGPDGHPKRGGFLPPVALPRRMWAGGRIEFRRPLRVGDDIRRESKVLSIVPKQGRSGSLVFVTVRHSVSTRGELAVIEDHDIVFRDVARPGEPPAQTRSAPRDARWRREIVADSVMLFRYSALTFIGQRIHYDLEYCRNVEGYPGLVVHGPLQVILLLDLARRHEPRAVKRLEYRALHPVFHFERFSLNGKPAADGSRAELWTANSAGNYAMAATAYF